MNTVPDIGGHVFKGPLLVLLLGSLVTDGSRLLPLGGVLSLATEPQSLPLASPAEPSAGTATVAAPKDDAAAIPARAGAIPTGQP